MIFVRGDAISTIVGLFHKG